MKLLLQKQLIPLLLFGVWFSKGHAADLYVNQKTGLDTADGRSPEVKAASRPFKTIARGVTSARPGDTVHLAPLTYTNEWVEFVNKSGAPGNPITLDGHGAVIDGSEPLVESDWHQVSPGLYRSTLLYSKQLKEAQYVLRFAFVMNGKLNRMGHSMKGLSIPYKSIADLEFGEWTYQENDEHAYFIKIDPKKTLSSYHIRLPLIGNAVHIYGSASHLVIKNLTATHVINDGFGISSGDKPEDMQTKVRDIVYENIKAIECCDDGMSSHADCELRVDGFEVDGCATGVANCGTDEINHLVTKNIHGMDVYYYGGKHVLKNSYIQVHGNVAPLKLHTLFGNAKWLADPRRGALYEGWDHCHLRMENVVFDGAQLPAGNLSKIDIADRSALDVSRSTVNQISTVVEKGGSLKFTKSLLMGGTEYEIDVRSGANWQADDNIYDIGQIELDEVTYPLLKFVAYQSASRQDFKSQIRPMDFRRWLDHDIKALDLPQGKGADIAGMGIPVFYFIK